VILVVAMIGQEHIIAPAPEIPQERIKGSGEWGVGSGERGQSETPPDCVGGKAFALGHPHATTDSGLALVLAP